MLVLSCLAVRYLNDQYWKTETNAKRSISWAMSNESWVFRHQKKKLLSSRKGWHFCNYEAISSLSMSDSLMQWGRLSICKPIWELDAVCSIDVVANYKFCKGNTMLILFSLSKQRSRAECIEDRIHEASVHVNHPQGATICQCENTHDNRNKKTRQNHKDLPTTLGNM